MASTTHSTTNRLLPLGGALGTVCGIGCLYTTVLGIRWGTGADPRWNPTSGSVGWVAALRAAWAKSEAVGQRAPGSLAIARSTTCRMPTGTSSGNGRAGELTCIIAISNGVLPSNGRCPDRHWYATTPSEYTSEAGLAGTPEACSGEM